MNNDGHHDAAVEDTGSMALGPGRREAAIITCNDTGPSAPNLYMTGPDHPTETRFEDIPISHLQADAGDDEIDAGDGDDLVETLDHGAQPLLHAHLRAALRRGEAEGGSRHMPLRIEAGTLEKGAACVGAALVLAS